MTVSTREFDRRAWVEVNLAAIVANARTVREAAGGAGLLPIVKAGAYGLGAVRVVRALEAIEPWGFGVATIEEAIELREAGIRRPIVVFTPAIAPIADHYRKFDLRAVLDDAGLVACWQSPFHLEIDTGMGRCGIRWDSSEWLKGMNSPYLEGAFTHLHSADTDESSVDLQWERFSKALSSLPSRPALVHAANSAGAFRLRQRLDLVRPGIFLYGGCAGPGLPEPAPVAAVRARVVSLRRLKPGETVSYGADWHAEKETVIATLGIGYGDGVMRSIQDRAYVLLNGARCEVAGRVTMDMTMVDLNTTDPGTVRPGDVATLIGKDGKEEITLDEFAAWAGTISYEVLVRLGSRLPRRYVEA